jgi:regulator of replication initiation timing
MAPIFKSIKPNGEEMPDEVIKMAPEMDAKIKAYMKEKGCDRKTAEEALMKSFDDLSAMIEEQVTLKKENERLRKSLLDAGFVIKADTIEKKAPVEYVEYDGEKIEKSAIPAVILKKLEADAKEKQEAAIEKKATETFPNLNKALSVAIVKADFDTDLMET